MNKKTVTQLSPVHRRHFLQWIGGLCAVSLFPKELEELAYYFFGGGKLMAQTDERPKYFLEINLRDQWDFGHVIVAPGLAAANGMPRGSGQNTAALYYNTNQLQLAGSNLFLTPVSTELAEHAEDIAILELCALPIGTIHGHEALNGFRSPGRSFDSSGGKKRTFSKDTATKQGGNEHFYSDSATPTAVHNHYNRENDPDLLNGLTMKGVGRNIHTVYHFEGDLTLGEIARYSNFDRMISDYQPKQDNKADSFLSNKQQQQAFLDLLARFDKSYFAAKNFEANSQSQHSENLLQLSAVLNRKPLNLNLTQEEISYWSAGVPEQVSEKKLMPIWQQAAYAAKLLTSRKVRTVSMEFDYLDIHGIRTKRAMDTMAKQTVLPLARLIKTFKEEGIWDDTIILINTLDGSRTPNADSFGNAGKNGFIMAGGSIKGGYYGDIKYDRSRSSGSSNSYTYHLPDLKTGVAAADGVAGNGKRMPDRLVYTTILKAIGIPTDFIQKLPNTNVSRSLNFFFKG